MSRRFRLAAFWAGVAAKAAREPLLRAVRVLVWGRA